MKFLDDWFPDVMRTIAFGGNQEEFARIKDHRKLFLKDESLRGPVINQCFNELIPALMKHARTIDDSFDYVHVTEYDHIIVNREYFSKLQTAIRNSKADYLAKACGPKTGSNWLHYLRYRNDQTLARFLSSFSSRDRPSELYGALGNGFTISSRALARFAELRPCPRIYFEVLFPSVVYHLGFAVADISDFSSLFRRVRWGPSWTVGELRAFVAAGESCCHPFKNWPVAADVLVNSR